jgi:hypothetical protein
MAPRSAKCKRQSDKPWNGSTFSPHLIVVCSSLAGSVFFVNAETAKRMRVMASVPQNPR